MKKNLILILLGMCVVFSASSQKRSMTIEDFDSWDKITSKGFSDNGEYIMVQTSPWKGDSDVMIYNINGNKIANFNAATSAKFSKNSNFVVMTKNPLLKNVEDLKLKKTDKSEMPSNKLVVYNIKNGKNSIEQDMVSYKLADEFVAFQSKSKDSLFVKTLSGKNIAAFANVSQYEVAEEANVIIFVSEGKVNSYNIDNSKLSNLYDNESTIKNLTSNDDASTVAFIATAKDDKTKNNYSLYVSKNNSKAKVAVDSKSNGMNSGWVVNEFANIYFTDGNELIFGTSPKFRQIDESVLQENRPNVHIWNWDESVQYAQQDIEKERMMKKSYIASLNLENMKMVQLADVDMPYLSIGDKGLALGYANDQYYLESMWEGRSKADYYLVDINNGKKELIKKATWSRLSLSPSEKFITWYNDRDSSWYSYSIADKKEVRLTNPKSFMAYDDTNDVPDFPSSLGVAGWAEDDSAFFINEKYDIWSFSPKGDREPINITKNGKTNKVVYRYVSTEDNDFISTSENQILRSFDTTTKGSGYYTVQFNGKSTPKRLIGGEYMLNGLEKSDNGKNYIYTKETFEDFGDIWVANADFKKTTKVTNINPQIKDINWGTNELVSWLSLDGKKLEGVIYYPENFDPNKKYPMVVNFYETNSSTLHSHRNPEPHRSTVDYHFYTSNEYIIFNPDIVYEDGYPGESAFNCIMPGISYVLSRGFVDEKRIGAQGHSWGGYQVAYLATRTDLFAAIESGAPVVNMFSAYGGVRWASGKNRAMQYEHQQSRIGATIWQKPLRYIENSPIFTMDKVNTPILIMSNDKDGHVPWWQGIEYFIALKRLGKPAWLLNYTGEPHWPQKYPNKVDFQTRMFSFFQHYLNGKPMPKWMKEGVKAVDRDFDLNY